MTANEFELKLENQINILDPKNMPSLVDRQRVRLKSTRLTIREFTGFALDMFRYRAEQAKKPKDDYLKVRQEIRQELIDQELQRFILEKKLGTESLRHIILTADIDQESPAEVVRALNTSEIGGYMPMAELDTRSQRKVYEAVGQELIFAHEATGEFPQEGDFLVNLRDPQNSLVSFSYGVPGDPVRENILV